MDKDGYPDDEELEKISQWDVCKYPMELVGYVQERWAYANAGYFKVSSKKDSFFNRSVWRVRMDTAGWSGNESIIGALQNNLGFWLSFWVSSRRGGHYVFEIPKDWGNKKAPKPHKGKR